MHPFCSRISSEVGLDIDSQQEEESSQTPDESDLPSTSQDPPSSSSAGIYTPSNPGSREPSFEVQVVT